MDKRRTQRTLAALCALALWCGCAQTHTASASKDAAQSDTVARVGEPAPPFHEAVQPGGTVTLASLRGKVVYLNFFATWCPPCNDEAASIEGLQQRYGSRGLQVVGVDVLENAQKAALFRQEHRLTYPAIVDDGTLRDQYDVNGLPVHVFIDRAGVVRRIVVGQMQPDEMQTEVLQLLR